MVEARVREGIELAFFHDAATSFCAGSFSVTPITWDNSAQGSATVAPSPLAKLAATAGVAVCAAVGGGKERPLCGS